MTFKSFLKEVTMPHHDTADIADKHGFNDNFSGGAGSDEYAHEHHKGHVISIQTRGKESGHWTHLKKIGQLMEMKAPKALKLLNGDQIIDRLILI